MQLSSKRSILFSTTIALFAFFTFRGVKPVFFDSSKSEPGKLKYDVIASLKEKGLVKSGDSIILTYGDEMEKVGATNTLKIVEVE